MVVPIPSPHRHESRGDSTMKEQKYDATYKFGRSTVHVVAPKNVTEEQKERVLDDFHAAGWSIIDRLEEAKLSKTSKDRLSG